MSFPGITNYTVPVPGTCVIADLGVRDSEPYKWIYSLWDECAEETGADPIAVGELDLATVGPEGSPVNITPDQAARIAFILEVEYTS